MERRVRRKFTGEALDTLPTASRSIVRTDGVNPLPEEKWENTFPFGETDDFFNLADWNPFKELENFGRNMSKLFESFSRLMSDEEAHQNIEVRQAGDNIVVEAEIPGVSKDNLDVDVFEDSIRLSGRQRKRNEYRNERNNAYRLEESYNAFFRTIRLPAAVKYHQAKVEFTGDVLTVTIPKKKP